jgi:hypothetical protein
MPRLPVWQIVGWFSVLLQVSTQDDPRLREGVTLHVDLGTTTKDGAAVFVDIHTGAASINLYPKTRPDTPWFHLPGGMSMVGSTSDTNLSLVSSQVQESLEHPLFGSYTKATFRWSSDFDSNHTMTILETSYLIFSDYEMVIFDQYFEHGWTQPPPPNDDDDALPRIVSPFPSIHLSSIPSSDDDDPCLGYLLWGDCFLSDTRSGDWRDLAAGVETTDDWGTLFDGDTYGQPWIVHDETGRTAVWSSLSNFFVSGAAMDHSNTTLEFGLKTTLGSIPKEFHHSSIMVAGYGINATMMEWGNILMKHGGTSGKRRADVYEDFVLAHLGYWTDNGGFHYRGAHPDQDTMEEALLAVKHGLIHDQGIPIRYMQWDDWWMESKGDIPGMLSWNPKPDVFPSGFSDWLGMPLAMYAPEYSGENVWITDYDWKTVQIPRGSTAIPLDPNFYRDLFRNGTVIGMVMFEQDFLCSYGIGDSGLTNSDVYSGATWLQNMDTAAQEFGIKLQFCMPDAYHLLESTKIFSVTNARATGDNVRNYRSILPMGQNGLLFYALGVYASRDNVWTTNADVEQVGCGNKDFCFETNSHLDNAVAVLSGGPYGIADKVGFTNKTVVMYACRTDGLMLRPKFPLATLDFAYTSRDAKGSNVWAAHDDFGPYRWSYVIGVELQKDILLTPSRLIQESIVNPPTTMVAWEVTIGRRVPDVTAFSESSPFLIPKSKPLNLPYDVPASSHTHIATAPVFPNGMAILGEFGKWATMSFGRVTAMDVGDKIVTMRLVGAPLEDIHVAYILKVPNESSTFRATDILYLDCTFPPEAACDSERDPFGNHHCRIWIVCQPVGGCECTNGLQGNMSTW